MTYDAAECIRRALIDEARRGRSVGGCHGSFGGLSFYDELSDAVSCLSIVVANMYDRGESARCQAVERLRELEAAGRALLDAERQS